MADEQVTDSGCLDFMSKKNKNEEATITGNEDALNVEKKTEEKETLLDKLRQSHSSPSSSDEEGIEGEKKRKKKQIKSKNLKERIKDKLYGDDEQDEHVNTTVESGNTDIVMENGAETTVNVEENEKKGFMEKIKDKLPGHNKKESDCAESDHVLKETAGDDGKEKKGVLGKLMDKLPGYHKEEMDKHTPPANH